MTEPTRSPGRLDVADLPLLRALVRGDAKTFSDAVASTPRDAEELVRLLQKGPLLSSVHPLLDDAEHALPPALVRVVHDAHDAHERKAERLLALSEDLHGCLAAAGIDALVLKGPLFAERFYGDRAARTSGDVDLWLRRREDLPRADRVLSERGITRRSVALAGWSVATHFTHHFEYRSDGIGIDLHWVLRSHFSFRLDSERIWRGRQALRALHRDLPALSDEDALAFLLLSSFTDLQHGKLRLKSVVDAGHLLRALDEGTDWQAFLAARAAEGTLRPTAAVLRMLLALLDAEADFPRLGETLRGSPCPETGVLDPASLVELVNGRDASLRNRLWGLRLYDAPLWLCAVWAVLAVPVKAGVYRRWPKLWERQPRRLGGGSRERSRA
jgi:hypothetical protein